MRRKIKPKVSIMVVCSFLALTLLGCVSPQQCYVLGSFCGLICAATGFDDVCVSCMGAGASMCEDSTATVTGSLLQQCAENPDECSDLLSNAAESYDTGAGE